MTRLGVFTLMLVGYLIATPSVTMAADSITDSPRRQIRTTDERLRTLLQDGLRMSPTLRALVARLQSSDVVVYLRCDGTSDRSADGRLTFVSTAGGLRYVVVRMARFTKDRQIALMAHELRHAVEIADEPAIVDGDSLVREYKRIGYLNTKTPQPGVSFDTHAAVETGVQVLKELQDEGDDY